MARYEVKLCKLNENAVNMICEGTNDAKLISFKTGIPEVDVLDIMNRVNSENRRKSFPDGD